MASVPTSFPPISYPYPFPAHPASDTAKRFKPRDFLALAVRIHPLLVSRLGHGFFCEAILLPPCAEPFLAACRCVCLSTLAPTVSPSRLTAGRDFRVFSIG